MTVTKLLEETPFTRSSIRLVMVVWSIGLFAVWAYLSISKGLLLPLDWTHILTAGIGVAGKVIQKKREVPKRRNLPVTR